MITPPPKSAAPETKRPPIVFRRVALPPDPLPNPFHVAGSAFGLEDALNARGLRWTYTERVTQKPDRAAGWMVGWQTTPEVQEQINFAGRKKHIMGRDAAFSEGSQI